MPDISQEAYDFVCELFLTFVDNLLDDPSDLLHPERDMEPVDALAQQRRIARGLGLDFDMLIDTRGHEHERNRLRNIEAGIIRPTWAMSPPPEPAG